MLAGIDVGWSKKIRSTGIALLKDDKLRCYRANVGWSDRARLIPKEFKPSKIAIDGPLLPFNAHPKTERHCETFFARGAYARRCKPGLSHFGTGYLLRMAAKDTFNQFGGHFFDKPLLGGNVVEAFPNLFLGVMVSDKAYRASRGMERGSKFDWLYDQVASNLFASLVDFAPLPVHVYARMAIEKDHELRAALICLLTAALAETGKAYRFGNSKGGWFWLPPLEVWEKWARNELHSRQIGFFPCYEDLETK